MPRGGTGRRLSLLLVCALLLAAGCADLAGERYERAEKELLARRMESALEGFRATAREHPQSRHAPAALMRQGDIYGAYFRNFPAALEAYDSLVFNYPRAAEVPPALLRSAEIHLLQYMDGAAAAGNLERIRREFPGFERMDEALFLLAHAYGAAGEVDRQTAVLAELVERHPRSNRALEGRWMLAHAFQGQRRYADAEREFRKLLFLAPDRKTAVRARWGVAQSLEGMGDLPGAIAQYEALRNDWHDPRYVAEKLQRLKARAGAPERGKERGNR
ncbi:MAG: tetratricopeptide repeat protein [Thermodesulfobacteriota bacterium]